MQSAHFSHSQQRLHCLLSPVPSLSLPPHHQLHQQLSTLAGLRFLHFLYQVWEVQNHQQLLPLSHSQQRLHCLLSPVPSLSLPPHHQLHQQLSPLAGLRFLHFLYQVWEVQNHQQLLPLSPGSQAPTVEDLLLL